MRVEGVEEFIDQPGADQMLPVEPDRRGVRRRVLKAKTEEAHERQPIAQLMFKLLV